MKNYSKHTVGQRIFLIRSSLLRKNGDKISQEQFGEMIGVSQSVVGAWERDERSPGKDSLANIYKRTGYRREWILFGTGHPKDGETLTEGKDLIDKRVEGVAMHDIRVSDIEAELIDTIRKISFGDLQQVINYAKFLDQNSNELPIRVVDEVGLIQNE